MEIFINRTHKAVSIVRKELEILVVKVQGECILVARTQHQHGQDMR